MKILVPIKRVPDYQAKLKLKADGLSVEMEGVKWIVNPFDEIAVEEAIRIKDAGKATEIIIVSIGPADTAQQIRYALAMGADRGILVVHEGPADSDLASRILAEIYKREQPGLVILGKQAIDSDASQTAQLLAQRLGVPQACFASKIVLDDTAASVTREVDGGLETITVPRPCVISTDLRLNEPRYASLPNIMKAKKKQLDEIPAAELGVDLAVKVKLLKLSAPPPRQAGKKVADVAALVSALQNEAKVL